MKKILSIVMTIAMLIGMLSVISVNAGAEETVLSGSGAETDPYLIGSVAAWNEFANKQITSTVWVKQTADLDFEGVTFTPISVFSGEYDGQGYSIYNVQYDNDKADDGAALFKKITGATIKNIRIDNSSFKSSIGTSKAQRFTSAIVAVAGGGIPASNTLAENIVENCYVGPNVTITSPNSYIRAGSIVGDAKTNDGSNLSTITIRNCVSEATLSAENATGNAFMGGIIGIASATRTAGGSATIENCVYTGTITAGTLETASDFNSAGGIAGELNALKNEVKGCSVDATVQAKDGVATKCHIGAIVGYAVRSNSTNKAVSISDCTAYSSAPMYAISAAETVGGSGNTIGQDETIQNDVRRNIDDAMRDILTPFLGYQTQTSGSTVNIRFVAGVSSIYIPDSSKVGFMVTRKDNNKCVELESAFVYNSLKGYSESGEELTYKASDFSVAYLSAMTLKEVPCTGTYVFEVVPYFLSSDGTVKSYGAVMTVTVSDGEVSAVS